MRPALSAGSGLKPTSLRTTRGGSEDLIQRNFTAPAPDLRWVEDISEFRCCDGELFLADILDLHDKSLVGWSMGEHQSTDRVVAALVMGLGTTSTL